MPSVIKCEAISSLSPTLFPELAFTRLSHTAIDSQHLTVGCRGGGGGGGGGYKRRYVHPAQYRSLKGRLCILLYIRSRNYLRSQTPHPPPRSRPNIRACQKVTSSATPHVEDPSTLIVELQTSV